MPKEKIGLNNGNVSSGKMKYFLIINTGSTSLKIALEQVNEGIVTEVRRCTASDIGKKELDTPIESTIKDSELDTKINKILSTHEQAAHELLNILGECHNIDAIAYRIVNGGPKLSGIIKLDKESFNIFKGAGMYAVHNPKAIQVINAVQSTFPQTDSYLAPDTAFHTTIPNINRMDLTSSEYINPVGAHGRVHKGNLEAASTILDQSPENLNIISLHVGGGSSITAIKQGKSYDTSMSSTPTDGLPMETRSGTIDPIKVIDIVDKCNGNTIEAKRYLNEKSGIYARFNGRLSTLYDVEQRINHPEIYPNDEEVQMCNEVMNTYINAYIKYIGSYAFELNKVDAIVLSGGAFENSPYMREILMKRLEEIVGFGIKFDKNNNDKLGRGNIGTISSSESKITVIINPANEERTIANELYNI